MTTRVVVEPLVSCGEAVFSVESVLEGTSYSEFRLVSETSVENGPSQPCNVLGNTSRIVVIDSVASGIGRTPQNDFYKVVMEPVFSHLALTHRYFKTDSAKAIAEFAKKIDTDRDYTLIVLSGDTSILELLNNLPATNNAAAKHSIDILTIPLGSANALANSVDCTSPTATFASFLSGNATPQPLPLYEVRFPGGSTTLFFIIFSMGFHANLLHLCTNHPKYSKMGVERFRLASTEILENYDLDIPLVVKSCSGTTITANNFSYFAIINTPNLEKTYIPSPSSSVLKRQLHILGYTSELTPEELTVDILKGYELHRGDTLSGPGIVYEPIEEDFEVVMQLDDAEAPDYKFEVCCDGLLSNLRDLSKDNADKSNVIKVSFLNDNDLSFKINIFTHV